MDKRGIVTLLFFLTIATLIILHPASFAAAVTAVGGQTYNEEEVLTGQAGGKAAAPSNPTVTSTAGSYSIHAAA